MKSSRELRIGVLYNKHQNISSYLSKTEAHLYHRTFLLLSEFMNFSFRVVVSDSGGVLLDNGTWTGLLGMLNRSEIDVAPENFLVTEQRSEAARFSYPFIIDDITFVTRKSERMSQELSLFNNISTSAWIAISIAFLTTVTLTFIILRQRYPFCDIVFHLLAVCFKQSPANIQPKTASGNLVILGWIVGTSLLLVFYTSVLLSFLSFPPQGGIRSVAALADAVDKGEYNCMIMPGGSVLQVMFSKSADRRLKIIGDNLKNYANAYEPLENFLAIKDEKIAYIINGLGANFLKGRYFISEDPFLQAMRAMATRRDFCCVKKLDKNIKALMSSGIFIKILKDVDFSLSLKMLSSEDTNADPMRSLNLHDLSEVFVFLIFGYGVSLIIFSMELLSKYVNRLKRGLKSRKHVKHSLKIRKGKKTTLKHTFTIIVQ